ncbi:enoyl-CoA hydratase-related protein [Bacillus sp. JJ634]
MDCVILEKHHHYAIIYLNEPETLNAFSRGLKEQLLLTLQEVEKDESIHIIILAGKGKSFCAGGDLKGMAQKLTTLEIKQGMDQAAKIVELIRRMPKLVISAVHGYAAGAGMSLALASDLIIAEEGSKFSLSFKNVGLIPDLGLLYHLPKKVGEWKAKEWIWKGVTIPVEEAYDYGFIYEIAEKNQSLERALVLAEDLRSGALQAFIHSKFIINSSSSLSFEEVVQKENMSQTFLRTTLDYSEGVRSFIEKRKPEFTGK